MRGIHERVGSCPFTTCYHVLVKSWPAHILSEKNRELTLLLECTRSTTKNVLHRTNFQALNRFELKFEYSSMIEEISNSKLILGVRLWILIVLTSMPVKFLIATLVIF